MKSLLVYLLFSFVIFSSFALANPLQDTTQKEDWQKGTYEETNKFPYFKDKYEANINAGFEDVWNAVIKAIEEDNCMVLSKNPKMNETGLYSGKIESDFCLLSKGDTTFQNCKYFSYDLPFIRGGVWENLRMQYKVILKEQEDRSVYLRVIGELSGLESLATKKVHFWKSNGYLETVLLEHVQRQFANNK